jgi:CMP-N,N'-diacetyllegionaminic acid synthase
VLGRVRYGVIVENRREAIDINEPMDFLIAEAALASDDAEDDHA